MTGSEMIANERKRQIEEEGWSLERDRRAYTEQQLAHAALCYVKWAVSEKYNPIAYGEWPWDDHWWRPVDKIRSLTKAGALIAAEIDRIKGEAEESRIR